VASDPGVVALAFGSIDFALDIDAAESAAPLQHARSTLVVAARAAGLPGPIDGVCVDVRNPAVAADQARRGRSQGFSGKLCVHPIQVSAVVEAYRPDAAEIAWARRIEEALAVEGVDLFHAESATAIAVEGKLVDRPVLRRARRILQSVTAAEGSGQREVIPDAST
jgi:citrate lyase subunit beta/citryl-CoA lyase